MSFKCQKCHEPQASGTKPVVQVEEVEKVYYFPWEEGEERPGFQVVMKEDGELALTSQGSEIVKETKVCRKCAGLPEVAAPSAPKTIDVRSVARAFGSALLQKGSHVVSCKKTIDECKTCQGVVAHWKGFPLHALSEGTQDRLAAPFKFTLCSVAVDNLIDRTNHRSVRASRDFKAAFPLLKGYEKRGGGL